MTNINVLLAATNFPDRYYPYIAPWSKMQADSLFKAGVNIEVVAPRPYTIPLNIFPYSNFHKLPIKEKLDATYTIHYPRFFYLMPKNIFFGLTGDIYSKMIGKYILQQLDTDNIDVVHSRFVYLDGYGTLNVCKKLDIPLVVDVHGSRDFGEFLDRFTIRDKQIKTLDYASKILCVAKWQIDAGIQRGVPEDKLEYVPLGVNLEKFKVDDKKSLRDGYGINEDTTIVLFVGQLIKRKGLEYLIMAIPTIVAEHNNVKFVIIGSGPEHKNLVEMCNEKQISKFVDFKSNVPEDVLIDYYSMADIFILPSLSEGQPTVIYEAMASETAVIGTNVGGIPEQIKDGVTGYMIPSKDTKSIIDKTLFLLDNPGICEQMGENAKKRIIAKEWTWEGYAQRVIRIYESLI